ncbi:SixA phosphatase family protein [Brevibacterium senegalense]|uniref:SixA phosphatase family protein n=1 Tax=Brevibacterium senegalense TaxID=1033736 RepID=UPI0003679EFD|nr:histidine phosphatase family protein [Brevibacterium senegalense]
MPCLVLARHAHTVPAIDAGTNDFDRPLSNAGLAQARRMGEFLASAAVPGTRDIDTVIASPALRTRTTAEVVAGLLPASPADGAGSGTPEVRTDDPLYGGWIPEWAEALLTIPAQSAGALIVGHQPTVSAVVAHLTDGGASGTEPGFPPSSIAVFRLEDWAQLGAPDIAGAARPELIRHFKDQPAA